MRLLHPTTLAIASRRDDIPKTVISHVWSEIFKYIASGQKHPKMFIADHYYLGKYLKFVYNLGKLRGCNLDINKVVSLPSELQRGFNRDEAMYNYGSTYLQELFDNNYLFSDACSLYFKGINIFPDIFGDEWRKYVPVESHKEIHRQVTKTLTQVV